MNAQLDIDNSDKVGEIIDDDNFLANGEQYLTFLLGDESYAVNILTVKEISGWDSATMIPNSPDYVKGVVNLRGLIVPIIDLRIRFDVGEASYLPTTVIIILSGTIEGSERTVGFVVDAVSDVLDVLEENIKKAPDFDGSVPKHYIYGMVNANENVVTILDIEQLIVVGGGEASV
ncbi:MAG: chemotaxis protein CheW [Cellvibrionaceae bacterium]|nr:chemotaxis protein CheW [Cellvibrionaceae bacterium]